MLPVLPYHSQQQAWQLESSFVNEHQIILLPPQNLPVVFHFSQRKGPNFFNGQKVPVQPALLQCFLTSFPATFPLPYPACPQWPPNPSSHMSCNLPEGPLQFPLPYRELSPTRYCQCSFNLLCIFT